MILDSVFSVLAKILCDSIEKLFGEKVCVTVDISDSGQKLVFAKHATRLNGKANFTSGW